jgi:predicted ATP-grasp superfamily ATP-dependent carboligase
MPSEPMSNLPPAIILNIEELSGLAAVRELGEHGVRVHGVARWRAPALYSRWLTKGYFSPKTDSGLIELLNAIAKREGPCFVIALTEHHASLIRRAGDAGELRGLRLLIPALDKLKLVNEKAAIYRIAEEIGVPVPRTWEPQCADDAAAPPTEVTYPCVLKYSNPLGIAPLLEQRGLPVFKSKYCYNSKELRNILLAHRPVGCYPLVQSYCAGFGLAHMLFLHEGNVILRFRHIRRLEWPPEGGVSAVCESLPVDHDDVLFAKSEALLKRIGWEGAAQVEYRYDAVTGRSWLMEINGGRFWEPLSLAYHAGAPFVWLTYAVLGLKTPVVVKPYTVGIKCRYIAHELRRLWMLLFRPDQVQNKELRFNRLNEVVTFFSRYLQPKTRYYLFSWRDPIPCIVDIVLKIVRMSYTSRT